VGFPEKALGIGSVEASGHLGGNAAGKEDEHCNGSEVGPPATLVAAMHPGKSRGRSAAHDSAALGATAGGGGTDIVAAGGAQPLLIQL
jgi:hypothetical protein